MGTNDCEEAGSPHEVDDGGGPKRAMVAEQFGHHSPDQHADSETGVPRNKQGGICRSALCVRGQIDEHGLKSRIHVAAAQPDDERGRIIGEVGVHQREKKVAEQRDQKSGRGILHHPTLAQRRPADKSRHNQTRGQQSEEQARSAGDTEFLFPINGDIGGNDAVGKRVAHHDDALAPALQKKEPVE